MINLLCYLQHYQYSILHYLQEILLEYKNKKMTPLEVNKMYNLSHTCNAKLDIEWEFLYPVEIIDNLFWKKHFYKPVVRLLNYKIIAEHSTTNTFSKMPDFAVYTCRSRNFF